MPRLTPTAGLLCTALVLSIGAWWLASVSLLAGTGFVGTERVSAQAASLLILGQWCLVALFAGHDRHRSIIGMTASSLFYVMPLWPLFALLWLSSNLSAIHLVMTQATAVAIFLLMALISTRIERLIIDVNIREMLHSAAGVAVAVAIWTGRNELHVWITA